MENKLRYAVGRGNTNWALKGHLARRGGLRAITEELRRFNLGLNETDLSRIVHGRRPISLVEESRLCQILGIAPGEVNFVSLSDGPSPDVATAEEL